MRLSATPSLSDTSARPPDFENGAISDATMTIFIRSCVRASRISFCVRSNRTQHGRCVDTNMYADAHTRRYMRVQAYTRTNLGRQQLRCLAHLGVLGQLLNHLFIGLVYQLLWRRLCVRVCVCVICTYSSAQQCNAHTHMQHALHTQVCMQNCITAGSSPSSNSGACVSSTSFKFLRSTYVSVTHTLLHVGCVPVRTLTRLFMHDDTPEYMKHDPVAPTRFWYLRIRLCSRRGKRPLSRSKSLP